MRRYSKFIVVGGAIAALAAPSAAMAAQPTPASADNGAVITNTVKAPTPGHSGANFLFFNGNGVLQEFTPTYYQEVLTASGVHNEVLKGTVANDTGTQVVYTANSGGPVVAGQTAWDFNNGNTSTDWQLTIEPSGNYTLTAHFAK
jgi:hypothetical protein